MKNLGFVALGSIATMLICMIVCFIMGRTNPDWLDRNVDLYKK